MAAGVSNLIIPKGGTYKKDFWYKDNDKNVIDLTGYTARMQVREYHSSTSTILDLTTENGGLTITALEGKVSIRVEADVTAAVVTRSGVYDIELVDSSGDVTKFVGGSVKFPEEVTK